MKNILVSVKMITFNHEPYIAKAIESVLMQKTSFKYELVIGEDCSTDKTGQIVSDYRKRYPDIIRVITSNTNVGSKSNSRRTLEACSGSYIAFLEGDDYWTSENKLQTQIDYIENHPDCAMVFTDFDVFDTTNNIKTNNYISYKHFNPYNITIESVISNTTGIRTCTVLIERDLLVNIRESDPFLHKESNFLMGDTQIWAEAATKTNIHYINESTAVYNILPESASRSRSSKTKDLYFLLSTAEMMIYVINKYKLNNTLYAQYFNLMISTKLRLAFATQNLKLAEEARSLKGALTLKEHLQYLGAKYPSIHHLLTFLLRR